MDGKSIIETIYASINANNLANLSDCLADDVQIFNLRELAEPIVGRQAALQSMEHMLSKAKNARIVFISGHHVMGDVIGVDYHHYYEIEGTPRRDHNVSIFRLQENKVKQWLGYIHTVSE